MSSTLDLASALKSLPERKERLRKVLSELESKKTLFSENGVLWQDVEEYLNETEIALRKTLEEYLAKEKALETRMEAAMQAIQKTEGEVSEIEQASLARVQEQRDAALAILSEKKKKWLEEKRALEEEEAKPKTSSDAGGNAPDKDMDIHAEDDIAKVLDMGLEPLSKDDSVPKEVTPRSELVDMCKAMDSDKLLFYMVERRKELASIGSEMPFAMKFASDPAQLVLNALHSYYPPEAARDTLVVRRACVIMLEALEQVLVDEESFKVSPEVKQAAKEVADLWISKFNFDKEIGPTLSLEAQSFLQLGATFKLEYDYNQDDLCKLVMPIARRRQTPALCRALGLSTKIPGLIEKLITDGKQIEAIAFAGAFDLLDQFEPVSLLKTYLKEQRKSAQVLLQSGNSTTAAKNDASQKELAALRAVLRAIGEYRLEEKYPPALLEKRVVQLEKAKQEKMDKKRANFAKAEHKRPRMNNGAAGISHLKPVLAIPDRAHFGSAYAAAPQFPVGAPNPYGVMMPSQYGIGSHTAFGVAPQYGPPQAGYGQPQAGYGQPQAGYGTPQHGYGVNAPLQAGYEAAAVPQTGYEHPLYSSGHYQYGAANRNPLSWSDTHFFPSDGLSYISTAAAYLNPSMPYSGHVATATDTAAAPGAMPTVAPVGAAPGVLPGAAPGTAPANY